MRRPVIALRAGGPECIITHGRTGLLFDESDPRLLADALSDTIENEGRTADVVARAYAEALGRYSERAVGNQLLSLLESHRERAYAPKNFPVE